MRKIWFGGAVVAAVVGLMPQGALAAPLAITCETFGPLPQATFGGSGIPNDRVCQTTFDDGANEITLALTATQRFANPVVTDDGAGTFFAEAGGDVLNGAPTFAKWNFDFFFEATGGVYGFELLYDFDPGTGTDFASLGRAVAVIGGPSTAENSWNLGMAFLDSTGGGVFGPAGDFNPDAAGQYTFGLRAYDANFANVLGEVAINVEVAAVPEPGSIAMLGTGLLGLIVAGRRRFRRKN